MYTSGKWKWCTCVYALPRIGIDNPTSSTDRRSRARVNNIIAHVVFCCLSRLLVPIGYLGSSLIVAVAAATAVLSLYDRRDEVSREQKDGGDNDADPGGWPRASERRSKKAKKERVILRIKKVIVNMYGHLWENDIWGDMC